MSTLITKYLDCINALPNQDNDIYKMLEEVYAENIKFIDPIHQINGLDNLSTYFSKLYVNTLGCQFTIHDTFSENNKHILQWNMQLSHRKLKRGATISLEGTSILHFNQQDKIIFHQDYFDLGQMLYENIPLLNKIIFFIKGKL